MLTKMNASTAALVVQLERLKPSQRTAAAAELILGGFSWSGDIEEHGHWGKTYGLLVAKSRKLKKEGK